jgi:hypothetical protein
MSVKKKKQLLATSCWLLALGQWTFLICVIRIDQWRGREASIPRHE